MGAPRHELLRQLSDADWRELLAFCDMAHLTLPLVLRNKAAVPGWVWLRAGNNLADNRRRRQKIAEAYGEIAAAFAANRLRHVVIKGFAQYPDFASTLDTRMQSDIDLYCPQEMIRPAQEVLQQLGYSSDRTLENYPADHVPEMSRRGSWQWRGNFYDPEMPLGIDLHYCLWNDRITRIPVEGVGAFWQRRTFRESVGFWYPGLCTMDNLAFSALHIVRDLLRGDWVLHHVYELACFLDRHAEDESFWETWQQTHDPRLRALQAIPFSLGRLWFSCRCSAAAEEEIERLAPPVAQWLHRFSYSPLSGMFTPNKHGLWLHMALLEGLKDKLVIAQNTLLPLRLPRVGAAAQSQTRVQWLRRFWPAQRHLRYGLHVILRTAFHLRMIPGTLWRGLSWHSAQKRA
jgi:hypothetical protein